MNTPMGIAKKISRAQSGRKRALAAAWVLYLASLALPAILTGPTTYPGFFVLMIGAFGMFDENFAWLANPTFFLASILYVTSQFRLACAISAVAALLALTSYTLERVCGDDGCTPVIGFGLGFYAWLLAILVLFLASASSIAVSAEHRA